MVWGLVGFGFGFGGFRAWDLGIRSYGLVVVVLGFGGWGFRVWGLWF